MMEEVAMGHGSGHGPIWVGLVGPVIQVLVLLGAIVLWFGTSTGGREVIMSRLDGLDRGISTIQQQIATLPGDHVRIEGMAKQIDQNSARITDLERDDFDIRAHVGLPPTDQRIHNLPRR